MEKLKKIKKYMNKNFLLTMSSAVYTSTEVLSDKILIELTTAKYTCMHDAKLLNGNYRGKC